ncbi:sulfite exporter TauE/SafE family protein [Yoonia sp. 2307UL14-13]|uniref:sulfite exporter TauE/SafE family protein n=1 Tax=Yoonia sp. 2307UL14-13 TaxID=3126506 RepID=UPI0030AB3D49
MDDVLVLAAMAVMLLVTGAAAGFLAGLFGVGGGIILVPAFFFVFSALGFDSPQLMQICLATSLATIIVTSIRSVLAHDRKGAVDWSVLTSWGPGIVIGALAGVFIVALLPSGLLQVIFGLLVVFVGLYMFLGQARWRLGRRMPTGIPRAGLSALTGFLSVLMGVGGGSLGVPVMTLYNTPIHRAVGTAAGFGFFIAVPSVIGFLLVDIAVAPPLTFGAINLAAFGLIVLMTLITAPIGAATAHRMDPQPLRKFFGMFLVLVGLVMLWQAF